MYYDKVSVVRLQVKVRKEEAKAKAEEGLKSELRRTVGLSELDRVEVTYDGSGDDGHICGAQGYDSNGREVVLSDSLRLAVENYTYHILPSGWEINEGSHGTLIINIKKKSASLSHFQRVESEESHTFKIDTEGLSMF